MFIKTLLFPILISITTAQDCSISDVLQAKNVKLPCVKKLETYRAMIEHAKDKFDAFYKQIDSEPLSWVSRQFLQQNRAHYERRLTIILNSLSSDIGTLQLVNNPKRRLNFCGKYHESAVKETAILSKQMQNLSEQLATELRKSNLPWAKIHKYEKLITTTAKIIILVDLGIKASRGLRELGSWMGGKPSNYHPTSNSAGVQKATVSDFESTLNDVIGEELGAASIGSEAEAAVQRSAASVVEHLRSGNQALEAFEEADNALTLEIEASEKAALLTKASVSPRSGEQVVIAARAAQAARASQVLRAAQTSRLAVATIAAQAARIAETADAAEAMSIAAETAQVAAAVGGAAVAAGGVLVAEGVEGAAAAGTVAGLAGTVGTAIGVAAPYAFGVIILIELANVAIKFAHEEYLKHHVDESFAKAVNESKQFGKDLMSLLVITISTKQY